MRHYHLLKNKYHCPIVNLDKLWALVGEEVRTGHLVCFTIIYGHTVTGPPCTRRGVGLRRNNLGSRDIIIYAWDAVLKEVSMPAGPREPCQGHERRAGD